jgi:D-arabinose 1-dehydrogenase-like Zn-dependent alcohol dehydrogenase
MGLQFAKAFGAEVTAFSNSKDKEADANSMGLTIAGLWVDRGTEGRVGQSDR